MSLKLVLVADFGQSARTVVERPAEIPKLQLAREISNVSPRAMPQAQKSPLSGHHRNLATLMDPEGNFSFFKVFLILI